MSLSYNEINMKSLQFTVYSLQNLTRKVLRIFRVLSTKNCQLPTANQCKPKLRTQFGFTLIEMMVAVALFSVVMTVSISALLSLVDANRKAQAMQSVMNNLNVSLDGMVRAVRMGTQYHCGCASSGTCNLTVIQGEDISDAKDCLGTGVDPNGEMLAFEPFGGDTSVDTNQWIYWFKGGRLYKSTDGGQTEVAITAPEVYINSFRIYVKGAENTLYSNPSDRSQPLAIIVVEGTAGAEENSSFAVFSISSNTIPL